MKKVDHYLKILQNSKDSRYLIFFTFGQGQFFHDKIPAVINTPD